MTMMEYSNNNNYLDLGGTTIKKCGDGDGEADDVVTVKYIRDWIGRWFPAQILGWFRENAKACYYFNVESDFIRDGGKIVGFKSQSKYYPVDAKLERGSLTSEEIPTTKKLCAGFPGTACLSVKGTNISPKDLYATVVVTVKFKDKSRDTSQQVYSDFHCALVAVGDKFKMTGTTGGITGSTDISVPRGLDKWNTVWIEWGTVADKACNVYIGIGKDTKHVTCTADKYGTSHILKIGELQGRQGLVGKIAAFEVYITKYRLPDDLREHIFKDHQSIVGI